MLRGKAWGFVLILLLSASFSRAEDGVTEKEILLGMSNAQTGPVYELGIAMKEGATVYFNKVNAAGGIQGRKIKLIVYDDRYEFPKVIANTRKFIEEDKVFALFGYIGSGISAAIVPTITRARVPYLFPLTGAEVIRNPVNKYIFNLRASYADEAEVLVDRATRDLKLTKIGVFAQDDAMGEAGRAGLIRALRKRNLPLVGDGKYERNTEDVEAALETLVKANPEAVMLACPYTPCAAFLKKARARGFSPLFLHLGVGTTALIHEAGKAADGLIVTQIVPNPSDSALPIVKEFVSDMKAAGFTPDLVSLESYLGAKVLVEALKKTSTLTREALISTLEKFSMEAGGLEISFTPTDHQGLHQVFLTKIENGKVVTIGNLK
ncbi:ABC transporter substrate-binding protein [Candidatus Manganitrophus noduliformans]|uniref:ABC transporter substrate-binding protein n=1 Tax=Candidatus Manganitrophus noduliformans TaxID=2606439 RepID=A0A7X6DP67_9BACT|nr:ABC transporter substrate-binding protein [Candidatus Manganitrophus noduliformans]NKE70805.1 ABC transporter substrate-binding protein [Candidatus Manganitrophus noduliformans]